MRCCHPLEDCLRQDLLFGMTADCNLVVQIADSSEIDPDRFDLRGDKTGVETNRWQVKRRAVRRRTNARDVIRRFVISAPQT